jgi:RimJ/RimL family protein N-acetyltransferase
VEALSAWAFATYQPGRLELLHQVDNVASCRVADKAGYRLAATLPAAPPFPLDGHLHVLGRTIPAGEGLGPDLEF